MPSMGACLPCAFRVFEYIEIGDGPVLARLACPGEIPTLNISLVNLLVPEQIVNKHAIEGYND